MNLNISELSLPNHILLALQGKLSAGNNIEQNTPTRRAKALNSKPVSIALVSAIGAIDSDYYTFEAHTLEGDNVHVDTSD